MVRGKQNTATMLYFAVYTINNLPLLFEIDVPDSKVGVTVVMKYAVP
jgi:hypothetical protein